MYFVFIIGCDLILNAYILSQRTGNGNWKNRHELYMCTASRFSHTAPFDRESMPGLFFAAGMTIQIEVV